MKQSKGSAPEIRRVSFIGLGVMGYPMAGHLAANGYQVRVYNRTTQTATEWVSEHGGEKVLSPAEAAEGAQVVCACVGNDADLREVTIGKNGAFDSLEKNAVFVDHTTASAIVARELAAICTDRGGQFIDAPVSGGQAGAENGILTVMVGGEPDSFERVRAVIDSYARKVEWMGPVGNGQLTKMVNQICIAGLLQGLSEGINFAGRAGLDIGVVLDVISKGAAQSWQMENRGLTMHKDEFDFGFAVDWMRKDLGMCLDEARRNGSLLPVIALVNEFYGKIQAAGGGRWDTSSLIRLLRDY
jgi:3-hydroxyisobutyrate dehydrogenase